MRTHSGEKPFSCNQCNFSRTTASYLKIHIRTHSGGKPFMCDQCDYSSTQAQHLKTHILTHTGARPFTCNQCSYSCNRSDSMKRHMLSHTGFCLQAMQLLLHKVNSAYDSHDEEALSKQKMNRLSTYFTKIPPPSGWDFL